MGNAEPEFVELTDSNLAEEHICCAIAGKQHQEGVDRKKAFLARGFEQGLVFRKLDVRGKVFIEYAPAEAAWRPVVAPGYLVIHCLWVSGRYKGHQIGRDLLQYCLDAAEDSHGVAAVAGRSPYLTDTRFYEHHGFEVVDRTETGYDLVCYRSHEDASPPRFAGAPVWWSALRICLPVPVRARLLARHVRRSSGARSAGHEARAGDGKGGPRGRVPLRHLRRLPAR